MGFYKLNATLSSSLNWKEALENVSLSDLVYLDFGLTHLHHPLTNETQFLSFTLAVQHLEELLADRPIKGVCFYQGSLDFSRSFRWDPEQEQNLVVWLQEGFQDVSRFTEKTGIVTLTFATLTPEILQQTDSGRRVLAFFCQEVVLEFLRLLSRKSSCTPYLHFDSLPSLSEELLAVQKLDGWEVICEGLQLAEAKIGLCYPSSEKIPFSIEKKMTTYITSLLAQGIPFRILPEEKIIYEWDELETLVIDSNMITRDLQRKIQGFEAAGGKTEKLL